MLVTRTRKVALVNSLALQARPHVSVELPRTSLRSVVASVPVVLAVVQEEPLFQDSATHILGEPLVLSARASRRTSMPVTVTPGGNEME